MISLYSKMQPLSSAELPRARRAPSQVQTRTRAQARRETLPCPIWMAEQKKRNGRYVKREGACLQDMQSFIFSCEMFQAAGERH